MKLTGINQYCWGNISAKNSHQLPPITSRVSKILTSRVGKYSKYPQAELAKYSKYSQAELAKYQKYSQNHKLPPGNLVWQPGQGEHSREGNLSKGAEVTLPKGTLLCEAARPNCSRAVLVALDVSNLLGRDFRGQFGFWCETCVLRIFYILSLLPVNFGCIHYSHSTGPMCIQWGTD